MEIHTVELSEWATQAARPHTVSSVRRTAIASIVVGALLLVVALAGLVMVIVTRSRPEVLFGVALLGLAGSFMLWSAFQRLRTSRGHDPDEQVSFVSTHAFRITDDTLEFPGAVGRDAESWPRSTTAAVVESRLGQSSLKLEHTGRKTRRYFAQALRETPDEVLRALGGQR